jgi:hypothetical protein
VYSTNWRGYIPNYTKDNDASGDSFGQILSDILGGVTSGESTIFRALVEFLKDSASGQEEDNDLYSLLQFGTKQEVAMEMDDMELVVTSLEGKQKMSMMNSN